MKKQIVLFGYLGLILIFLTQCEDRTLHCTEKCFTPPDTFRLRLINKSNYSDLITSGFFNKDSICLYYFNKKVGKNIEIELEIYTDSTNHKTTIYSNEIGWISASGFKDFFLKLNSIDIDTLYLDVVKINANCCIFYPCKTFKYNGQIIQIDKVEYDYKIEK
jgi:hypothetical protein